LKGLFDFIITPKGKRYNNTKQVGDTELVLNASIEDHLMINRTGIVKALPSVGETNIQIGDEVILHHNVFRRYYDAATKKLAIFDAFEILNKIQDEQNMLDGKVQENKSQAFGGFAENRSK
jgi:hypothetical protein